MFFHESADDISRSEEKALADHQTISKFGISETHVKHDKGTHKHVLNFKGSRQ